MPIAGNTGKIWVYDDQDSGEVLGSFDTSCVVANNLYAGSYTIAKLMIFATNAGWFLQQCNVSMVFLEGNGQSVFRTEFCAFVKNVLPVRGDAFYKNTVNMRNYT